MRWFFTMTGLAVVMAACGGSTLESPGDDAGAGGSESAGGVGTGGRTSGGTAGRGPGGAGGDGAGGAATGGSGAGGAQPRVPAKHRAAAVACDSIRPSPDPGAPPPVDGGSSYVQCRTHAECTDGVNGRCGGNGHDGWSCTYDQCTTDGDCNVVTMGAGAVCACEGGSRSDANTCLTGNCRTDSDCGGSYCSPSYGSCGAYTGVTSYYCHTLADECTDDADCGGDGQFGSAYCAYSLVAGRWTCSTAHCVG